MFFPITLLLPTPRFQNYRQKMRRRSQDQQAANSSGSNRRASERVADEDTSDDQPTVATTATDTSAAAVAEEHLSQDHPSEQPHERIQGRITFYSTDLPQQQPSSSDPSTAAAFVNPSIAPLAPSNPQPFYQYASAPEESPSSAQSAFTRLPPFSTLVSSSLPETQTQPGVMHPRPFTPYPTYEIPRPKPIQQEYQEQQQQQQQQQRQQYLQQHQQQRTGAHAQRTVILQPPGTARVPIIPFIFHHPKYGSESCILGQSQRYQPDAQEMDS